MRNSRLGGFRRTGAVVLATAVVSAVAAGCGSSSTSNTASSGGQQNAGELTTITIASSGAGTLLTPYYVASAQGFFKKNGLNVKTVQLTSPSQSTAALVSGQTNVLLTALSVALQIRGTGTQIEIPVGIAKNGITNLVARKGSGITSVKDLAGKTVGITATGSPPDLLLQTLLRDAGVNASSVHTLALGTTPASFIAALQHGTVDAAMTFDPITAEALDQGIATMTVNLEAGQGPKSLSGQYFEVAVFARATLLLIRT
jgi:NitT/TauT family transport system substrate-binding protein